jgi:hypothetical protein
MLGVSVILKNQLLEIPHIIMIWHQLGVLYYGSSTILSKCIISHKSLRLALFLEGDGYLISMMFTS